MLELELRGETFNKAEYNRRLRALLTNRSKGAVEFKHENISALMIELGLPYIDGYKPRTNYQELLRQEIILQWDTRPVLSQLASLVVSAPAPHLRTALVFEDVLTPAPMPARRHAAVREVAQLPVSPRVGVNYLEVEARNALLGRAGEEYVVELESQRLRAAGATKLARRVEHVAQSRGDGLGYDILSFEEDGRERLIEVKTTGFGAMTPFYASRREVAVSEQKAAAYWLYRLFKFREHPRLFLLQGALSVSCQLDAVQYSAKPR